MTSFDTLMNTTTLAQRMAEGRIPISDALRYAMQIAESLRQIHDEGRVHGSVSPLSISVEHNNAALLPSMVAAGAATPYSAPEVLAGKAPDTRSDIFSFGTVVYEMLTGKRAFDGTDRTKPAPSGSPAVDRFVAGCVASNPLARLQSVKRVMMELKLLHAAARRAESSAAARSTVSDAAIRAQLLELETRLNTRLQDQQKNVAEMRHAVTDAVATLRGQLAAVSTELGTARDRANQVEHSIDAAGERIVAHVQNSVDAASERIASAQLSVDAASVRIAALEQGIMAANNRIDHLERVEAPAADPQLVAGVQRSVDSAAQRIAQLEQALQEANQRVATLEQWPDPTAVNPEIQHNLAALADRVQHFEQDLSDLAKRNADLHDLVAQDLRGFEKSLQSQGASIESARTAMAQTDDLVERVVEALESLQTIVLEQSGDRAAALA
jgi:predicted  nucleic acid-binding Zn-ribbon protein